jgi:hypothetical protein
MPELQTTNVLLGILAAVAVLQFLLIVAGLVVAYRAYAKASARLQALEQQSVAPLVDSARDILSDVKAMTSRLNARTARFDQTVKDTGERVQDTTERVRTRVRAKVMPYVAFFREFRDALRDEPEPGDPRPPR